MASDKNLNIAKVDANLPAPGVCTQQGDDRSFLQWLIKKLIVVWESVTSLIFTQGRSDPDVIDNRGNVHHYLTDSNGVRYAERMYAGNKWVDYRRMVVGEIRIYNELAVPDGWFLADGGTGTQDMTELSEGLPDGWSYFEFRGFGLE